MARARALKTLHCGLGPIGQAIVRIVLDTEGLQVAGATDSALDLAGADLGTLLGRKPLRVKVDGEPDRFLKKAEGDLAVLCTASTLKEVKPQVLALVARGLDVITTCEELAYPTEATQAAFREIDKAALARKATVLGTGVNPGFAMDALALVFTAPCAKVERVVVTRVVDAASRRLPLQRKVGAGLALPQFRRAVTEGSVRHVGLKESVRMIADALGWTLERIDEVVEPAVAPRDLETPHLRIPAGSAAGLRQLARGYRNGTAVVSLDLQMYVGAESPRDQIFIDGDPPLHVTVAGGIPGDTATAAMVVNMIPKVVAARPGLLTMRDLPLPHRFNAAEVKAG